MKIVIVSCSPIVDYVRARTLRNGFAQTDSDIIIVKNEKDGYGRYLEVISKLIKVRFREKPDAYVITFRGYEILPFVLLIAGRKKVIFDEFVNPIEWAIFEHHKLSNNSTAAKVLKWFYRLLARRCYMILADTVPHSEYSSQLNQVSLEKYSVIPVGTDEKLFKPHPSKASKTKKFTVFYYGQLMNPLHGLDYILESAVKLSSIKDIQFIIAGGGEDTLVDINKAIKLGANIDYRKWIDFEKFPAIINKADLCLGGPFGATIQSKLVVTGKTCQFLASEKPVIVGETKITDVFIDKKNCLLVSQGNSTAITEKILWAYKNPMKLKTIAKNGRKTYDNYFSEAVIAQQCKLLVGTLKSGV